MQEALHRLNKSVVYGEPWLKMIYVCDDNMHYCCEKFISIQCTKAIESIGTGRSDRSMAIAVSMDIVISLYAEDGTTPTHSHFHRCIEEDRKKVAVQIGSNFWGRGRSAKLCAGVLRFLSVYFYLIVIVFFFARLFNRNCWPIIYQPLTNISPIYRNC